MLWLCELINGNIIRERFYRDGESPEQLKAELERFEFGPGIWRITNPDEYNEEE